MYGTWVQSTDLGTAVHRVWVQLVDRIQQRLVLVLIPVEQFVYDDAVAGRADTSSDVQTVVEERAPSAAWINVTDVLHFLPSHAVCLRYLGPVLCECKRQFFFVV